MALPASGSLSIKSAAGAGRSISQEVDGNETGNKSLTTLSVTAGKVANHSMLEFYNYSGIHSASFGRGSSTTSACDEFINFPVTLYYFGTLGQGTTLYTETDGTTPLTGYTYVAWNDGLGRIYNINTSTGVIGTNTGSSCP